MDPAKVDVNVHPAKLEVRFQEDNKVFKAIYHAIKDTLLKSELVANTEKTVEGVENFQNVSNTHKNSGFTDLFRKITKSQPKEENERNPIEDIYKMKEKNINNENMYKETSSNVIEDLYNKENDSNINGEIYNKEKYNNINEEYNKENYNTEIEELLGKSEENNKDIFGNKTSKIEKSNTSIIEEILGKKAQNDVIKDYNSIEDIYNKKEENDISNGKIDEKLNVTEFSMPKNSENTVNQVKQDKKMDVFKELMAMQQRLKEEAKNNPNLHTNIDTIIENTEKLKNQEGITFDGDSSKDNNIYMSNMEKEVSENMEISQGNITTYELEENKEETQNMAVKEDVESYQIVEKGPTDLIEQPTYANIYRNTPLDSP